MEHAQSPDDGRDDADDSSVGHSEDEDELVPLPCIVPGCGSVVLSNLNTGRVPCTDHRCTIRDSDGKQCWGVNSWDHGCPQVTASLTFFSTMSVLATEPPDRQYTGDQRTVGTNVCPTRTLLVYNNNIAIPAAVMSRLVSQVNQVADAPVQDLFLRQKLAARLARNRSTNGRGGLDTVESRLKLPPVFKLAELAGRDRSINDLPALFRIVAFDKGRFQVHSAHEIGTLWTDVRVSAKGPQRAVRRWPELVRLFVDPKALVAEGALKDAVAMVASGRELDPELWLLRADWTLQVDVNLCCLPDVLSADVLLPSGFRLTARRAYRCHTCGAFRHRLRRCSRCTEAHYCSAECQTEHWPEHKQDCVAMRAWRRRPGN